MKPQSELKTKKLNLVLTPYEYSLLAKIRQYHNKSVSAMIRDAIIFYGVYYPTPEKVEPTE